MYEKIRKLAQRRRIVRGFLIALIAVKVFFRLVIKYCSIFNEDGSIKTGAKALARKSWAARYFLVFLIAIHVFWNQIKKHYVDRNVQPAELQGGWLCRWKLAFGVCAAMVAVLCCDSVIDTYAAIGRRQDDLVDIEKEADLESRMKPTQEVSFHYTRGVGKKLYEEGTDSDDAEELQHSNEAVLEDGSLKMTVKSSGFGGDLYEGENGVVYPLVIQNDGSEELTGVRVFAGLMQLSGYDDEMAKILQRDADAAMEEQAGLQAETGESQEPETEEPETGAEGSDSETEESGTEEASEPETEESGTEEASRPETEESETEEASEPETEESGTEKASGPETEESETEEASGPETEESETEEASEPETEESETEEASEPETEESETEEASEPETEESETEEASEPETEESKSEESQSETEESSFESEESSPESEEPETTESQVESESADDAQDKAHKIPMEASIGDETLEDLCFTLQPGESVTLYLAVPEECAYGTYEDIIEVTTEESDQYCSIDVPIKVYAREGLPWQTTPDRTQPVICYVSDAAEKIELTDMFEFNIVESEEYDSGIERVECYLNGDLQEMESEVMNTALREYGEVATDIKYQVRFKEEGINTLVIKAVDYEGNETVRNVEVQVVKEEDYHVVMPQKIELTVDPAMAYGSTQIYNLRDFAIENDSLENLLVSIEEVFVTVKDGQEKKCSLNLAVMMDGEEVRNMPVDEISSSNICDFVITGKGAEEGEIHKAYLMFTGMLESEEDDWHEGDLDVKIQMKLTEVK